MPIKSKDISKYYIEQIILSNEDNPNKWTEPQYQSICRNDKLIGYLFSTKESIKFNVPTKVLNMYLIKPSYFEGEGITLNELSEAWNDFSNKCNNETHHSKTNVFKNPPIKQWIDTKENWCKKLAAKISEKFGWEFYEALSEVYYTVMKCYAKEHVYMGNLGYIQTAVYNNVRMVLRFNKNRLNQDSGKCESLDQKILESDDGEVITLADCLGEEDKEYSELEYEQFEKEIKETLSENFSDREIEQILTQKAGYLPMNLYRRLNSWRKNHSPEEFIR